MPESKRNRWEELCVLDEVLLRPDGDLLEGGNESPAPVGEGVGDGNRRAVFDGSYDEPGGAEVGEPIRKHRVGDPPDCARELTKACRPAAQHTEDNAVPALAEELEGAGKRSVSADALIGFGGRLPWLRRRGHGNMLAAASLLVF